MSALAAVEELFRRYGLDPGLAKKLWDELVVEFGTPSDAQVDQAIRATEQFKVRFRAIEERRKLGLPAISPTEVLEYERAAARLMRASGLPPGFYDQPDDFVDLLVRDVSPRELEERVTGAFARVASAPPEVRAAFAELWGADGDGALASFVLDADKAIPKLMEQVATAEVSGFANRFGFDLNKNRAVGLAQEGIEGEQAREGFARLDTLRPLFTETISETEDLDALDEGVDAVFGTGTGTAELDRRRRERAATTSGGGGTTQGRGGSGLGAAD